MLSVLIVKGTNCSFILVTQKMISCTLNNGIFSPQKESGPKGGEKPGEQITSFLGGLLFPNRRTSRTCIYIVNFA